MKNVWFIFAFLFFTCSIYAQVDVKINPIGALFGNPDVSAEFLAADGIGVEVGTGITFGSPAIGDIDYKFSGVRGFVAGKYYLNEREALEGFSVGLYMRGGTRSFKAENDVDLDENFRNNRLSIGLMAGQKWLSTKNNLLFEIDFGAGRAFVNNFTYDNEDNSTVDVSSIPFVNIDLLLRIAVGYRF